MVMCLFVSAKVGITPVVKRPLFFVELKLEIQESRQAPVEACSIHAFGCGFLIRLVRQENSSLTFADTLLTTYRTIQSIMMMITASSCLTTWHHILFLLSPMKLKAEGTEVFRVLHISPSLVPLSISSVKSVPVCGKLRTVSGASQSCALLSTIVLLKLL